MGVELDARHQVSVPLQHVHTLLRGCAVHLDEVSGHTEEVPATRGTGVAHPRWRVRLFTVHVPFRQQFKAEAAKLFICWELGHLFDYFHNRYKHRPRAGLSLGVESACLHVCPPLSCPSDPTGQRRYSCVSQCPIQFVGQTLPEPQRPYKLTG